MSRYLINTVETYRTDSESEAALLIQEAKESNQFTLSKYSSIKKERKQKGEVIDEWYRVSLTKTFTDEKEPDTQMQVAYEREGAF